MAKTAAKTTTKASETLAKKTRNVEPVNVTIDEYVAMPTTRKGLRAYSGRFPFNKMDKPGLSSFALPVPGDFGDDVAKVASMLSTSARAYSRAHHDNMFAFTIATVDLGNGTKEVRIWRKEDAPPRARKSNKA